MYNFFIFYISKCFFLFLKSLFIKFFTTKVPPEAMHPQPSNEASLEPKSNEETNSENSKNFTYRTEIVGNVVMKKKISESKLVCFQVFSSKRKI